jgi:hypothetical protein
MTSPIRASYAMRPRRRIRARHIAAALALPPALAASAGLSIAIIEGTRQGMAHTAPITPAPCAPRTPICFDTPTINTTGVDDRRPALLPPCPTEDSLKGPCLWAARIHGKGKGRSFIITSKGALVYLDAAPDHPLS